MELIVPRIAFLGKDRSVKAPQKDRRIAPTVLDVFDREAVLEARERRLSSQECIDRVAPQIDRLAIDGDGAVAGVVAAKLERTLWNHIARRCPVEGPGEEHMVLPGEIDIL